MHPIPKIPTPGPVATLALLALAAALALLGPVACGGDEGPALVDAGDAGPEAVDVAGELTATTACSSCGGKCTEEAWIYAKTWHEKGPIQYAEAPPSGGIHHPCWWNWGSFAKEVPAARFVHNLEHGGLVLTYDCKDGCAAEVGQLQAAADAWKASATPETKTTREALVTPYAGAAARFVALCWQHRLLLDCVDDSAKQAIAAFALKHCPEAPEQVAAMAPDGCM